MVLSLWLGLLRQPPRIGGQIHSPPPPGVSPLRLPSACLAASRTVQHPFAVGDGRVDFGPVPESCGTSCTGNGMGAVVHVQRFWWIPAPWPELSCSIPKRSLPRRSGRESGAWHVPTHEEPLICISFSSYYRAAGCEAVLTAAVGKVQAAAITSDWLKTPMAAPE